MRVLHITHQFPPETFGGLESYVHDLATGQIAAGDEAVVLTGTMTPADDVRVVEDHVGDLRVLRLHRYDLYFDSWDRGRCPEASEAISKVIRDVAPDVVHVHHWIRMSDDIVSIAHREGRPAVVTLHDLATSCPRAFRLNRNGASCLEPLSAESCASCVPHRPWQDQNETGAAVERFKAAFQAELLDADRILCATTFVRDIVASMQDVPRERFAVEPLGYRPKFSAGDVKAPGPDEPFRFAFWGAITERKGVEMLLEAFAALPRRLDGAREVELHVFGRPDTPERNEAIASMAEGQPVTLYGRFEYEQIAGAGISAAVFPSHCFETYGLVLDEAFELGIPVIVPDGGGVLTDRAGDAGLTFKTSDVDALADALETMVRDEETRRRLIDAIPGPSPSPEQHVPRLRRIYDDVIAGEIAAPHSPAPDAAAASAFRNRDIEYRRLIEKHGDRII